MNVFINNNYLRIDFSDGQAYQNYYDDADELRETIDFITCNMGDEEALKERFLGVMSEVLTAEDIDNSEVLVRRGISVYMPDISEISIPDDLIRIILKLEKTGNVEKLQSIRNFWTLLSLNPDARVRNNLFWFIRKWNVKITKAGLLIAYRNAVVKNSRYTQDELKEILNSYYIAKFVDNVDPNTLRWKEKSLEEVFQEVINSDNTPVYTDAHSHSTTIRLGHPVSIPRSECDPNQENSCSKGLHVGAAGWLENNYFGNVGLQVLVNPAKVVAVPTIDEYGKMRTCEYFPVALIDFDGDGHVVEPKIDMSQALQYLKEEDYNGEVNNTDYDNYRWNSSTIRSNEDIYNSIIERLNGVQ